MSRPERPWGILVGCFLMSVGYNAYFIAPASVVSVLERAYDIDTAFVGLIYSACLVGAILFSFPGGIVIDRYDNRQIMGWSTVLFAGAIVLGALASSYLFVLFTRFLAGVASVFLFTMNAKVVGDVFPPSRLGLTTSVYVASAPTAFALAQVVTPWLVADVGFWGALGVYGAVAAIGFVVFLFAAPSPIRSSGDVSLAALPTVIRNRSLLLLSLSGACAYLVYIFLNSWLPTYASATLGVGASAAGALAALLPVTGLLARPTGGWLSDRLGDRRRVIAGASMTVIPLLAGITVVDGLAAFALLVLLSGFAIQLAMGLYYVLVRELSSSSTAGTSLAVFSTVAYFGSLIGPAVGGVLIDAVAWQPTFVFYLAVSAVAAALVLALPA